MIALADMRPLDKLLVLGSVRFLASPQSFPRKQGQRVDAGIQFLDRGFLFFPFDFLPFSLKPFTLQQELMPSPFQNRDGLTQLFLIWLGDLIES